MKWIPAPNQELQFPLAGSLHLDPYTQFWEALISYGAKIYDSNWPGFFFPQMIVWTILKNEKKNNPRVRP